MTFSAQPGEGGDAAPSTVTGEGGDAAPSTVTLEVSFSQCV